MLKIVVLIYMNKSGEISLPFCANQGVNLNTKCLSVHQSVFHTVVCHQNFNLAIFQTVGGKALIPIYGNCDHCDKLFPIQQPCWCCLVLHMIHHSSLEVCSLHFKSTTRRHFPSYCVLCRIWQKYPSLFALVLVLPVCVFHLASFVTIFRMQLHNAYQMG